MGQSDYCFQFFVNILNFPKINLSTVTPFKPYVMGPYSMDTHMETCRLILFLKCHIIILRFLNCSDKWTNEMKSHIDQLITYYIQKPNPIEGMETIITHTTFMQSVSKKDQLKISTHF